MNKAKEVELVCSDFNAALDLLRQAGLRLDVIHPADAPHTALLSSPAGNVRLTSNPREANISRDLPAFRPQFVLTRSSDAVRQGRAGMSYRDLIPGRLGGRYAASQIVIAEGGPVADWTHFHRVALQLIYVRRGWVKVVYEDQGEAFVMEAGDLVLQPPGIRHRVLESSADLEVIEITCPALHETLTDHELELPNGTDPSRRFGQQRFLRHIAAAAVPEAVAGAETQGTAASRASGGLVDVRTVQACDGAPLIFSPHDGELIFGFVLDGSALLHFQSEFELHPGDAFVIPPGEEWRLSRTTSDFRLLHVLTNRLGTSF